MTFTHLESHEDVLWSEFNSQGLWLLHIQKWPAMGEGGQCRPVQRLRWNQGTLVTKLSHGNSGFENMIISFLGLGLFTYFH